MRRKAKSAEFVEFHRRSSHFSCESENSRCPLGFDLYINVSLCFRNMIFDIFDIHWYPASATLLILASNLCFFGIQHGARCDMVWLCFWKPFTQCKHRRMCHSAPQCTTVRITWLNFVQLGSAVLFRGFNLFQLGFTFEYVRHGLDVLNVRKHRRFDAWTVAQPKAKRNRKFGRSSEEVRKKFLRKYKKYLENSGDFKSERSVERGYQGYLPKQCRNFSCLSCLAVTPVRHRDSCEAWRITVRPGSPGISRDHKTLRHAPCCAMRHEMLSGAESEMAGTEGCRCPRCPRCRRCTGGARDTPWHRNHFVESRWFSKYQISKINIPNQNFSSNRKMKID